MKGKDYIDDKANAIIQPRIQQAYQNNQNTQGSYYPHFFVGTISADFTQITDTVTGQVYSLSVTGSPPQITNAVALNANTAVVTYPQQNQQDLFGSTPGGLILGYDSTWAYVRTLGSANKYYLPFPTAIPSQANNASAIAAAGGSPNQGFTFQLYQYKFSSDGKAILIGAVQEDINTESLTQFHQFAYYDCYQSFTLVKLTDETELGDYTFPVNPSDSSTSNFILLPDKTKQVSNSFDINSFTDGLVPCPAPSAEGSSGIWYPFATIQSLFNQFNPVVNLNWDADSTPSALVSEGGLCLDEFFVTKITTGNQDLTYVATPSSSRFNNFQFTFNNDLNGNYNIDLGATFVNAYLIAQLASDWQEAYTQLTSETVTSTDACSCSGGRHDNAFFSETNHQPYSISYDPAFAYNLTYLPTPDLWVPTTFIQETYLREQAIWLKSQDFDTGGEIGPPDCGFALPSFETPAGDPCLWNAQAVQNDGDEHIVPTEERIADVYFQGTDGATGRAAAGAAFANCNGFPVDQGNVTPNGIDYSPQGGGTADILIGTFYSGMQQTTLNSFGSGLPGCYIYFGPFSGDTYTWNDGNYDNIFLSTTPNTLCVFSGRSTAVITNLIATPTVYGANAQYLGNGKDFNTINSFFRGRDFSNTVNTAYVYKQNYTGTYFYSSPALSQGNLGNIAGTGSSASTGGVTPTQTPSQDAFGQAIAQLVDWSSLADAYGDTATEAAITQLILTYEANQIPSDAALANVQAMITAMDPDLTTPSAQLTSQLTTINQGLSSGNNAIIGPDVIGALPPDVYTNAIFSPAATFPFQPGDKDGNPYSRFLKAPDSYIVTGYWIGGTTEFLQNYNIADGTNGTTAGETSLGNSANGSFKVQNETLIDYVLPIARTAKVG